MPLPCPLPSPTPTTNEAVLITGGRNTEGNGLKSVEIYLPASNTGCSLPELPEARSGHTQDGGLACGGSWVAKMIVDQHASNSIWKSCVKWTSGSWTRSHSLIGERSCHVSWATASGVYLIGGYFSQLGPDSTELVKEDGSVEEGFQLKHPTK